MKNEETGQILDEMHKAFTEIGDLAEGLNNMLAERLSSTSEAVVVDLVLKKIVSLSDQFM